MWRALPSERRGSDGRRGGWAEETPPPVRAWDRLRSARGVMRISAGTGAPTGPSAAALITRNYRLDTAAFVKKETAGGGAINDMGVYHLGLMLYLLGMPTLKSVSAATFQELDMDKKRQKISGYNVEELAVGLVHFEGGLTMFFEEAWAIHSEGGDGDRIYGSKAGMKLNPLTVCTNIGGIESDAAIQVGVWDGRMNLMGETPRPTAIRRRTWCGACWGACR